MNCKFKLCLTVAVLLTVASSTIAIGDDGRSAADRPEAVDVPEQLQRTAIHDKAAEFAFWGTDREKYTGWTNHSNRLIPVYTYGTRGGGAGIDLSDYTGDNSIYRSAEKVRQLYGYVPDSTVNSQATFMDQTQVADIQRAAIAAGRKYVFLVVFDGMDWQTTYAAATYNQQLVGYKSGRGNGTHFQEYDAAGTSQFALMVTSPHNSGTETDASTQTVTNPGGELRGGYDAQSGGPTAWDERASAAYLISKPEEGQPMHAYTDSASSATSMTAGHKTFNGAINVDASGGKLTPIAHEFQEQGIAVGAVSSVPISHATPAAAYAHNVTRNDYQDLTRDLLGRPSVQHPEHPLSGMDVVIGGGYGVNTESGEAQGDNFVSGNKYLTKEDLDAIDIANGGRYVTAVRTAGVSGRDALMEAAGEAARDGHRLLGFYGVGAYSGHLPFATANGDFRPAPGVYGTSEKYSEADLNENPTLADMTTAALTVLSTNEKGFWLMVEAGDVDWANHDDNLDNSIGAVLSGDAAVKVITDWVEQNSNWSEALLIVTADHGHMLNLTRPAALTGK